MESKIPANAQIIYAWNYKQWGGVQIYFLSLIKEVRRHYRVIAVIPEDSDQTIIDDLKRLGTEIEFLPPAPDTQVRRPIIDRIRVRYRTMAADNRMVNRILELSRRNNSIVQPDIGFWLSALAIFRLTRNTNVVITHHTPLKRHWWLRDLIIKAKGQFVASLPRLWMMASNAEGKKSLSPYMGERKSSEVLVTYAGFNENEIEDVISRFPGKETIRKKYGLSDAPILVTVGQFIVRKGCWVMLDALRQMASDKVEFTFLWLSTSTVPDDLLEKVGKYDLGSKFRIIPANELDQRRYDLLTLLLAAEIFVLASLEEGLPIALVEAMALGKACLATNINAIPEAIDNGVNGVTIEPNDPDSLAKELTALLLDNDRREMLGANARSTAYERFNEKTTAAATLELYESVWESGIKFRSDPE